MEKYDNNEALNVCDILNLMTHKDETTFLVSYSK